MKKELKINNKLLTKIIEATMEELTTIFVSEADFQFSFAWLLKKQLPNKYDVILEYPIPSEDKNNNEYIDIAIVNKNKIAISYIELKYKTLQYETEYHNIKLKNQSARDLGNYLFLKDVQRMEKQNTKICNYCIFLTNDKNYWFENNKIRNNKNRVLDINFKLYDGKTIKNNNLVWELSNKKGLKCKHWTDKYPQLKLLNKYECN